MPEDYYADAAAPNPGPSTATEEAEPEEGASDNQTAVLPKSVLGGKTFKPGEEVVLEVVQVMEDSVVVKYASDYEEEPAPAESEEPESPMMGGGGNQMSALME